MAKADLTVQFLRSILSYDPDTGVFTWIAARKGRKDISGQPAGCITPRGYKAVCVRGWVVSQHRLAWFYVHGEWPNGMIDHINGVKTDNRIANLRVVDPQANNQNVVAANARSKSGLRGVSQSPNRHGRWEARISAEKRTVFLGVFDTPQLAHAAYLEAKRKMHAGFVDPSHA